MNAGGVPNTCKSSGGYRELAPDNLSGGRVRNTWVICPLQRDNVKKLTLIPHKLPAWHRAERKDLSAKEEPAAD